MRIILSIALSTFLLVGHALAAEQQPATKHTKGQKAKAATAEQQKAKKPTDQSHKEKLSYSLGYDAGKRMKANAVDIDPNVYSKAFSEGFSGKQASMTDEEMRAAVEPLQKEMQAKRSEEMQKAAEKNKELGDKNKAEGDAFLAENGKKEGVVTLPSGLQYKVIKEGTGKSPQKTDKVKVHYRGTLVNGTEFDSSHKRGQPAEFGVDKVIKGWTEALQLMKEGAQWTVFIPPDLAYGPRGAGATIGPNSTLIFEVELISVQ
jgi:FKBP-type peptidyl-prolyl cis-trans isomerase FklB